MENRTTQLLFALLRSAVSGASISDAERELYSVELLPEVLELADKHDLLHLVSLGLKQNFADHKSNEEIRKNIIKAVYRYEQLNFELEKVCKALENAGIPHMPLKGSVIRKFYPEPWMRSSCDVDVLVQEEQADQAAAVLSDACGYVYLRKGAHDISLRTPNHQYIELHYTLMEDKIVGQAPTVLKTVWDTAQPRNGYRNCYEMPEEMFYFYHIAHMAKHVVYGGCGIRPFMDLWILDRIEGVDWSRRETLLRQGGLWEFAQAAGRLSRVWFCGERMDRLSRQLEDYILRGGVFGNSENRILIQQQKQGGKLRFILSRVFLAYDEIKFLYPILQKHRWLMPVMEVRRWIGWILDSTGRKTLRKLKISAGVSTEQADSAKDFLHHIGL